MTHLEVAGPARPNGAGPGGTASRDPAGAAGLAIALAALVATGFLSIRLADARREDAEQIRAAVIERDRAATPAAAPARAARRAGVKVCPRSVDGYARAISIALGLRLLDEEGHLDTAALARLSGLALTAERRAERAAVGPALPQRMGRGIAPATAPCVTVPRRRL